MRWGLGSEGEEEEEEDCEGVSFLTDPFRKESTIGSDSFPDGLNELKVRRTSFRSIRSTTKM